MRSALTGLLLTLTLSASACGGSDATSVSPPPTPTAAAEVTGPSFAAARDAFFEAHFRAWPVMSSRMGLHEHDGKLPDLSAAAMEREVKRLDVAISTFSAMQPSDPVEQLDREMILSKARSMRFMIADMKLFDRSPLAYLLPFMGGASPLTYVARDYAPVAERAKGLIATCEAIGPHLEVAKTRLPKAMPKSWVQIAMMMSGGMVKFSENASKVMPGLDDVQKTELEAALGKCKAAWGGFATFLKGRMADANDDYRLGSVLYLKMLRDNEALDISIERLSQVAEADLARNLASLEKAAKAIDPKASVKDVVARVTADKPPKDGVLKLASAQCDAQRQFVLDKQIVTIPSEHVAEVKVTPVFMRFNFAFLNSAGPFEKKALPSFYYVTPPNPAWPEKKQKAYVPSRHDLFYVSAHEVWPGHFLHSLHKKRSKSLGSKAFCSYAMSEGWAHYVEEMMWDAGAAGDDPMAHIGQLKNALLRNVRFVVSLGLHTGKMTVPEAHALFVEKGFQDDGNAMQQAARGTFDPGYLSYTLGKLMIMKLKKDYQAKTKASDLVFHDTFLSYQCAPVSVIRRFMLGDDAGPAL
jgi:hypothetical protein